MDFRTPCQIFLGVLLAAISLSVLGLAAHNVSYVNNQHGSPVDVHYTRWNQTAQAQYSYWVKMDYLPSRFSMGTMDAMIVVSLVSIVLGAGVAVAAWMMRGKKALATSFSSKNQSERSFPLLPIALIGSAVTFLASFAIAVYVWHPVSSWPKAFQSSLPLPPKTSASNPAGPATYRSPFLFSPETWNCFLSPHVVDPSQSRTLDGLCRETQTARYLMIPQLIISAALLFTLLWTWRQARSAAAAAASDAENAGGKEIEEVSVQGKD